MKILITTGLSKNDIGGPARYGPNLKKEFESIGYKTKIVSYGRIERILPIGIRHIFFFLKILPFYIWAEKVITLDTFSVGVPSIMAAKLFGKKLIVRVGGDFLWESYVERTGKRITLRQFNENIPSLSMKERIILSLTRMLIRGALKLVFNSEWQRKIWERSYNIASTKTCVVRNYIPEKSPSISVGNYFLWAGRNIKLKNVEQLRELSVEFKIEIVSGLPRRELEEKIKNCYAVVLPSYSEVCPNFILEAVSFGKPFIMTEETGFKEVYNKGGIFINPFDKKALKQAILEMSDLSKYEQYKKDLSSFRPRSWQEVAKEFLSLCQ